MKQRRRDVHKDFSRILIEDEDVIFSKDSDYHKQKEKKNPIFKRNKRKR